MLCLRSSALLAIALVVGCYNPGEDPEPGTSGATMTEGDDGASTGQTLGMTSSPGDDGDDATSVDPPTSGSTVAAEESSGDGGSTMGADDSSDSGPLTAVCGDGMLDDDEQCDDSNRIDGDFCAADCTIETHVFAFTGMSQSFEMPAWANAFVVEAWGAQGGAATCCDPIDEVDDGGRGGYATGTLAAAPGETVFVFVGGEGVTGGAGGWNGGGFGGEYGAGGGGASDVRLGGQAVANRALVAGAGGGGNCGCPDHGVGGPGGGLTGGAGISLEGLPAPGGGTQSSGGTAGAAPGMAGGPGVGGSFSTDSYHVAGGGGGWYGGGSAFAAGGAGGSSYLGAAIESSTQPDQREGDGEVRITPAIR